jgi:hypothetical protein
MKIIQSTTTILFLFFIGLFLVQCSPNTPIEADGDPVFRASSPNQLFFKNTRSHHYRLITQRDSRIDHYSWKNDDGDLQAVIADNWLSEEAYLLVLPKDKSIQNWQIVNGETVVVEAPQTRREHYDAALSLYRVLQNEQSLQLVTDAQTIPLFQKEAEKTTFETVVKDYLRLVEKR